MRTLWKRSFVLGLLCLTAVGCQSKIHDDLHATHQQNRELQAEVNQLRTRLREAPDPAQLQAMRDEIAQRDAEIARLQDDLRQPSAGSGSQPGLDGIETSYDPQTGTVTVNLPGDVLFDSGQADLKNSAKATLDKIVAAIQRDYRGKQIFVDGHTDTDPIRRTADRWTDNLDLSAARAMAVTRYLTEQGIEPSNVVARAFGEHRPRGSKAASRRVEIVVAVQ